MDLKAEREAAGMTIRELAERTGIPKSTLARIDSGERECNVGESLLIDAALEREVGNMVPAATGRPDAYPSAPAASPRKIKDQPTEENRRRKAWMDRRNAAIQAVGPRPADGVTFGKVPKSG